MQEQQATRAHGRHPRLQTALTAVCHFNYPHPSYSLTIFSTQTKSPTPDLHPGMDPLRANLATQIRTAGNMKTHIPEHPFQWVPSARIWIEKPVPPTPRHPRDAIRRRLPPFSRHSQSPVNARALHEARIPRLPNALRRNLSRNLLYLLTTSRSTRVTMKTRRVSRGTATVMRSVSARWLLVIMMPVRANGSICRVWG